MGELKIPGFSEYLHPLGARAAGRRRPGPDAAGPGWGAQVGLFDVTDLTNPRRIDVAATTQPDTAGAGRRRPAAVHLAARRSAPLLTVISKGWTGRTGWVSVLTRRRRRS